MSIEKQAAAAEKGPASTAALDQPLQRTEHGPVSVISMVHRPHNLLGPKLMDALLFELEAARSAGSQAVVLRSGLRHFSAGAEIDIFERIIEEGWKPELLIDGEGFLKAFEAFTLPIVASIHGVCVGGGFELALACDYVVAAATAKIGCVECTLGLHPLMGAVQRVTQRAGALRAKEMSLLGRRYDPATLERWGLVNLVVADEALETATMTIAQELARGPTIAHTATKRLVQITVNQGVEAADEAMLEIQKPIWSSEDLAIGVGSYLSSGAPGTSAFKGR